MDSPSPIIGIDFGTTNSKMAWYNPKTNQAEIIMNAEGELQTPSVVYFGKDETLIGNPALEMLDYEEERERVILSIKRELTTTPFIALPGKSVKPVEVATEILRKLKRDAEERLFHRPVTRTVITYPASFGPLDRDKIREAAQSAGFDEIELLEEPVAAAIAYTQMGLKVGKYVLVYDLGGGTFDLAVLAREDNGSFRPALEPQGIKRCGGDDFDEALYNYCDQVAREQYGRPISLTRKRDLHFLKECRQRKENLAITKRRLFKSLLEPGAVLFEHEIERVTFESLISPTVEETVRKTKMLLEQASAERQAVDTVVLIGGSSRIPLVRRLLEEGLPLKPLQWEKQDIAVALGASYRAYSLWKPENQYRKAVELAGTDKKLDEIKITQLSTLANDLGLTEDQAADIEREVMGETKEAIFSHQRAFEQYHLAMEVAWAERRLDEAKVEQLKALANELGLKEDQAADIERGVMGETKEANFAHQLAYHKAVEEAWSDKKLNRQKIAQLYTLAARLNLSDNQVDTIELAVMDEIKEVLFVRQYVLEHYPEDVAEFWANPKRKQYLKAVQSAWSDKEMDQAKLERLTALAKELALSKEQVAQIERKVMSDTKEVIFDSQRQERYRKAVEAEWRDKKLDGTKIIQLSTLANDLGLTEDQAADIEREVMGETKKVLVFKTRLLQVLRTFQSQNNRLYVSPNIPWNKFADARVKCNVPQSEEILGLIDCNSIGSATILFGTEGIYYFGLVFRDPGGIISNYQAVKIPYSELFLFPVRIDNKQVAAGNGKKIYLGESGVSREKLRDMLNAIKGFSD